MKVTLTYDLPEEFEDLEEALFQGPKALMALSKVQRYLRSQYKHAEEPHHIARIYENFCIILDNEGVEI